LDKWFFFSRAFGKDEVFECLKPSLKLTFFVPENIHPWKFGDSELGKPPFLSRWRWWFQICFMFTPTWGNDLI